MPFFSLYIGPFRQEKLLSFKAENLQKKAIDMLIDMCEYHISQSRVG